MKRKDILLIGGNGFVGRHLFKTFSNTELYKVSIIDKHDNPNVQCNRKYIGNIENLDFVNHCIADSNPELIYYLVSNFSITSVDEFADEVKRSIIRINNIFNCLNSNIRLIWTGSSAQYGAVPVSNQPVIEKAGLCPVSNYGSLKSIEESEIRRLAKLKCINLIYTRIFNISGPSEPTRMVGGAFVSQLMKSPNLNVGNLFPKRDFLDVRDVASALKTIGEVGETGCTYNISSGRSVSIESYLKYISEVLNIDPVITVDEGRINKSEIEDLIGDNSKLKKLGWERKFNLKQTVTDLITSYLEN